MTQIFERVWYGSREVNAEEYAEAHSIYEQLAANATVPDENRSELLFSVRDA